MMFVRIIRVALTILALFAGRMLRALSADITGREKTGPSPAATKIPPTDFRALWERIKMGRFPRRGRGRQVPDGLGSPEKDNLPPSGPEPQPQTPPDQPPAPGVPLDEWEDFWSNFAENVRDGVREAIREEIGPAIESAFRKVLSEIYKPLPGTHPEPCREKPLPPTDVSLSITNIRDSCHG